MQLLVVVSVASFMCVQRTKINHRELELAYSTYSKCPPWTSLCWAAGHSGKPDDNILIGIGLSLTRNVDGSHAVASASAIKKVKHGERQRAVDAGCGALWGQGQSV